VLCSMCRSVYIHYTDVCRDCLSGFVLSWDWQLPRACLAYVSALRLGHACSYSGWCNRGWVPNEFHHHCPLVSSIMVDWLHRWWKRYIYRALRYIHAQMLAEIIPKLCPLVRSGGRCFPPPA
jgi:hypothetical protein